jgi:quinol monooxygenase YgiN
MNEETMTTADTCCSVHPYLTVHDGKMAAFKKMCAQFVELTSTEPKCLYYGFTFDGNQAHCREGYADADGMLAHLDNVGALFVEMLKIADMTRLEVHGPAAEIDKLREPLADFSPRFYILEQGFRR